MTRKEKEKEKNAILKELLFSYDQQPGESGGSYKLFLVFRDMGRSRSYGEIVKLFPDKKYNQINQLGARHQWFKRANDWDLAKEKEMNRKLEDEILYARIRQANLGKKLQALGEKGVDLLVDYPDELTAADIAKLISVGQKIESLALGSSTEIVKSDSKIEAKVEIEEISKEIAEKIGKEIAMKRSVEMEINV